MNVDEILNTPRRVVNVDAIQLPESMEIAHPTDNANNAETDAKTDNAQVTMTCGQLANMAIGVYNAIQTAIYKRIEPRFDATLTPEETEALLPPTKAVLEQYNVQMSPMTALLVVIVGINMGKIMQLKMMRTQWDKEYKEKKEKEAAAAKESFMRMSNSLSKPVDESKIKDIKEK